MRRLREILIIVALLGIGVATGSAGTWANWAAAAQNTGNAVGTGTIALVDDDNGSSVFVFSGISPGPQPQRCVLVRNAGTASVNVELYGEVSGELEDHMTIKVLRGDKGGTCTAPGATSVLYDGELNAFPTSTTGTRIQPSPIWEPSDQYPYLFEIVLRDDPAAQGKSASVGMSWRATP